MDVRFSAEQRALLDSAAQVMDRLGPKSVRDLDDHDLENRERASKLDAAVEASGWRELRAAAEDGGPLASAVEAAIVAEEMGRSLADASFIGATLAADLRRRAGAPPTAARETVALAPDLSVLAGTDKTPRAEAVAVDARESTSALAVRQVAGGFTVVRLDLATDEESVDLTRRTAPADLGGGVALPGATVKLTTDDLLAWTALGLALTCADLVGVMRGAISLSTEYVNSRKQFRVAVGSFQALQHLLADAQVGMEGSKSVALHAAWAVDSLSPHEAVAAASVAKAYCARASRTVCETAIQAHGGVGNTWDCLAHVFLRRSILSTDVLGGVGPSLQRVMQQEGIGGLDEFR